MHIPAGETSQMEILSFKEALEQALKPQNEYDGKKWLYVPCHYEEYRYILGTCGLRPLICVGVNPSTACPGDLDNTLKSVSRIAEYNGYDGFTMFNLYAQRATNPADMEKTFNRRLHMQNMEAFAYILENAGEHPAVWAAWGAVIEKRDYLLECAEDLWKIGQTYEAKWYTCGKRSTAGHPHHPLYLRKDSLLEEFDLPLYISTSRLLKHSAKRGAPEPEVAFKTGA